MLTGIAGALLVFTGVWHATEWMMDGRRRDTMAIVPAGLIYLLLGYLLVTVTGGITVQIIAAVAVTLGGTFAFLRRNQTEIRNWVLWTFIVLDVIILLALILGMLG